MTELLGGGRAELEMTLCDVTLMTNPDTGLQKTKISTLLLIIIWLFFLFKPNRKQASGARFTQVQSPKSWSSNSYFSAGFAPF